MAAALSLAVVVVVVVVDTVAAGLDGTVTEADCRWAAAPAVFTSGRAALGADK